MLSRITISPKWLRAIFVLFCTFLGVVTLLRLPTSSPAGNLKFDLSVLSGKQVNWSRFAYTQYATDRDYLCNSVMMFETLNRLGSKADRLLMYSSEWSIDDNHETYESNLLRYARDHYAVKLKPIEVQVRDGSEGKISLPLSISCWSIPLGQFRNTLC